MVLEIVIKNALFKECVKMGNLYFFNQQLWRDMLFSSSYFAKFLAYLMIFQSGVHMTNFQKLLEEFDFQTIIIIKNN